MIKDIIPSKLIAGGWVAGRLGKAGKKANLSQLELQLAELGQAQLKYGFDFPPVYLYQIDELEILLARLTPTTTCPWAQVEKSKSNFKWLILG